MPRNFDETVRLQWLSPSEVTDRCHEAYAVRAHDALHQTNPAIRAHDGINVLHDLAV